MSDAHLDIDGSVAIITLDRPSVGGRLFEELLELLEQADATEGIGAIVTIGTGRAYCAGADAAELGEHLQRGPIDLGTIGVNGLGGQKGLRAQSPTQIRGDHLGIGRWVQRVLDISAPMVAALNGATAGGGLGLALLHDVRIGASSARIHAAMPSLGLAPEMGMSWFLPRLLGSARAFDVLTRTEPISAEEAVNLGLIAEVIEPSSLLDAAVTRAARLAALPGARVAKRLLRTGLEGLDTQLEREWMAQRELFARKETSLALQAMVAARRPTQQ